MRKILQFGFSMIVLLAVSYLGFSQVTMPAAITIDPPNATGWDEITLTLDANGVCVPDGKGSIIGQSDIRMHSAAFLIDNIENWGSSWGDPGIDFNAQPLEEGFDFPSLTDLGEGIYSITFTPGIFYGVPEGSTIIGITAVFNAGGGWNFEAKDHGEGECKDFYIPLTYEDPTPGLLFTLDLTYQEELGNFDQDGGEAYVIVNETEYMMEQLLEGIFPVARYEKKLTEADDGITAETSYAYKFKMDDTEETVERDPIVAGNFQSSRSHFFNDEEPPRADVTFIVDMTYAAREGIFVPGTDNVDIAGSLMGWDEESENILTKGDNDTLYTITFEDVAFETIIEYKYRINGLWETSEFPDGGPNRHATVIKGGKTAKSIYNNYRPGNVPVTLSVDMNREIANGRFDAKKNFVAVVGTMNDWSTEYEDELFDEDGDGIYITDLPVFAPVGGVGDTMEYKFRIDASWDDAKHEFPGGAPGRKYIVVDTTGGVENVVDVVWFNDMVLGIDDQSIEFQEVSFYPNPVNDIMYIENKVGMQEIRINNILGQEVIRMRLENRQSYQLNTSELEMGLYILNVIGEEGYVGTAKFIKQ